jgi:hypothetical protein
LMRRESVDDRRAVAAELPCILRFRRKSPD